MTAVGLGRRSPPKKIDRTFAIVRSFIQLNDGTHGELLELLLTLELPKLPYPTVSGVTKLEGINYGASLAKIFDYVTIGTVKFSDLLP